MGHGRRAPAELMQDVIVIEEPLVIKGIVVLRHVRGQVMVDGETDRNMDRRPDFRNYFSRMAAEE